MEIKTKFNIGQTVYYAVFGDRIDEFQIEEITIAKNGVITYQMRGGLSVNEDELSDTREEAIEGLIRQEERRHKRMIEYLQMQKEEA